MDNDLPYVKGSMFLSGTNEEKLYFILWNQYLTFNKIEFLKDKLNVKANYKPKHLPGKE